MLESHILLLVVFALCVSIVFAALMRDDVNEQVRLGVKMFGGLIATALILGWLMYPFPIQFLPLKRVLLLWGPVIAYMAAVYYAQSLPEPPAPPGPLTDKHEHFFFYGVLALLALRAFSKANWRGITFATAISALVFSSLYGVVNEYHQLFVPGRSYDVADMIANTIGASVAVVLVWAWSIIRPRSETHDVL